MALSGCITTTLVAYASAKKIPLKGVESRFEGDIDLRGFLHISEEVPVGFQEIRVYFKIDADISDAEKEELVRLGEKFSPVTNTIKSLTPFRCSWRNNDTDGDALNQDLGRTTSPLWSPGILIFLSRTIAGALVVSNLLASGLITKFLW